MNISAYSISLEGLELSQKSKQAIHQLLRVLKGKSPSGSHLNLQLVNGECEVNGFLSIRSGSYRFEATHCGVDPLTVMTAMNTDLLAKLRGWIDKRTFSSTYDETR